ncbi:MAG: LapA family protein [Acidimicrobiales bacterium]
MDEQLPSPGAPPPAREASRRELRPGRLVLLGVSVVVLVWFAVANLQDVRIRFWVSTSSAPLIVVIVISGFLGAAASGLWSWLRRRRRAAGELGGDHRGRGRGVGRSPAP